MTDWVYTKPPLRLLHPLSELKCTCFSFITHNNVTESNIDPLCSAFQWVHSNRGFVGIWISCEPARCTWWDHSSCLRIGIICLYSPSVCNLPRSYFNRVTTSLEPEIPRHFFCLARNAIMWTYLCLAFRFCLILWYSSISLYSHR